MAQILPDTKASVEYIMNGKTYTADLQDGYCEVVKVPSINIGKLRITKVSGEVSVLSLLQAPLPIMSRMTPALLLSRKYYDAATGQEKTTLRPMIWSR